MKVARVLDVSRRGYPVTTAFSSLHPGISGIGFAIAAGGVHNVEPRSYGIYSQLPQAIARVIRRTSPDTPLKKWGEERPRPARVDAQGAKT